MALIQCPECKTEISDKAVSCPKCGNPMAVSPPTIPLKDTQKNLKFAGKCAFMGFLLGFVIWWGGCFHGGGNFDLPDPLNELGVFLFFGSITGAIFSIPGFLFGLVISKKDNSFLSKISIRAIIGLVVLLVVLKIGWSLIFSPNTSDSENVVISQNETPIKVSAIKLYSDYKRNEVAADEKYKGKLVEVTGVVGKIAKYNYLPVEYVGLPYVLLKTDNESELTDDYSSNVGLIFSKDNISSIATLKLGKRVTFAGRCMGIDIEVVRLKVN